MSGEPEYFDAREGRALFGSSPQGYHDIRPPYPEQVYEPLLTAGALGAGTVALEIGAGSGLATRRLLEGGASPLTVVEPDARFVPLLNSLARSFPAEFRVVTTPFEDAALPHGHYDLVAAATSFHWIEPAVGLAKVADVLKPGGHVALWWHVFGNPDRTEPFHLATQEILRPLANSPGSALDAVPFALDVDARLGDFARAGRFETPEFVAHRWTLRLSSAQTAALYSTFSHINRLPEVRRTAILHRLMEVAETRFGGEVEKHMVSCVYLARAIRNRPGARI